MPFEFKDLDEKTRDLMTQELDRDLERAECFVSGRLTAAGAAAWPDLLRTAMESGNDESLSRAIGPVGGPYLLAEEPNPKTPGALKAVPHNAASTLAEGEFNRFYIRAVCRRAGELDQQVEIYRARSSSRPDPVSEAMIGKNPDPAELLADLRANQGVATALGLPSHPNSGLSVQLVR